jgi:hypothetical protein
MCLEAREPSAVTLFGRQCSLKDSLPQTPKSLMTSITLSRTSRVPLQAKSLRSQALDLVTKRVNFLRASRALRFRRIRATQFFQRLLDGEFGCFGHDKPHIKVTSVKTVAAAQGAPATAMMSPGRGEISFIGCEA